MTIEELKSKSAEISERVAYLAKFLKIADHQAQVRELEGVMTRPDFWDDKEKAQETVQKLSSEKNIVEPFENLRKHSDDFCALAEFAAEDESFLAEADTAYADLEKEIDKMELLSFLSGKFDRMNCFFFIHAGAGGTESCDWASILLRMYRRWFERKGFKDEKKECPPVERFFSETSFWNTPIPADAEIDPRSDEMIGYLKKDHSGQNFRDDDFPQCLSGSRSQVERSLIETVIHLFEFRHHGEIYKRSAQYHMSDHQRNKCILLNPEHDDQEDTD